MAFVVPVVRVERGDVVDHEPSARLEDPEHLVEGVLVVTDIRHRLDRVHRIEQGAVEIERLVEVADGEVGNRQVRVAVGLLDLGSIRVDAV